jgi:hypothetical protein
LDVLVRECFKHPDHLVANRTKGEVLRFLPGVGGFAVFGRANADWSALRFGGGFGVLVLLVEEWFCCAGGLVDGEDLLEWAGHLGVHCVFVPDPDDLEQGLIHEAADVGLGSEVEVV